MNDIHVEAMHQAHTLATQEADVKVKKTENEIGAIREESRALGVLQKINHDNAHNELLKYATLYQIKQDKGYKTGGMTWEEFCEATGEPRRTIESKLKDIRPIVEVFTADFAGLLKVPFNKIRYLGRSIPADSAGFEDGNLIIDNIKIPLVPDNKEEIEAAIDTLIESHKQEKQALKKDLQKHKKQTDKIVEEETRGLHTEVEALVKEVDRLKPFDIKEKDQSWSEDQMKKVWLTAADFSAQCRLFVLDDRIEGDRKLQARVEMHMQEAEFALQDLRQLWVDRFVSE